MLRTVRPSSLYGTRSCLPRPCGCPPASLNWTTTSTTFVFSSLSGSIFTRPTAARRSPMETYLRMMVLKYRYDLGFEPLCAEVSDSVSWRRFCRVPLDEAVPHPSALEKLTAGCGQGVVDGLNEALLAKAAEGRLAKLDKVRADTTVVRAHVNLPFGRRPAWQGRSLPGGAQLPPAVRTWPPGTKARDPAPLDEPQGALDQLLAATADRRGRRRGAGHNRRDGQDHRACPGRGGPGGGQLGPGPAPPRQPSGPRG